MKLLSKYSRVIAYLFFGVCTTAVNVAAYHVFYAVLNVRNVPATIIAWFLAIVFAFITNKRYVFDSKSFKTKLLLREAFSFLVCRAATGIFDVLIMYAAVDLMNRNATVWKIVANIIVIILNYAASRAIIFKKGEKDEKYF